MNKQKLEKLLRNNQQWAEETAAQYPGLFASLAHKQSPQYLWIGCSDSRVPAETLLGLLPGDIFVHRNVGNLVHEMDINTQSVLEFAVASLKVSDIIVCGHTDCGAIKAAASNEDLGVMNYWLSEVKDVFHRHEDEFHAHINADDLYHLSRLNTIKQVENVCHSAPVQRAWAAGQQLIVHGLLHVVGEGKLLDLDVSVDSNENLDTIYKITP